MNLVTLQMTVRKFESIKGERPGILLELKTTPEQNITLDDDREQMALLLEWLRMHEKLQVTLQAR